MGELLKTFIMPHPPIMIKEIGDGEEEKVKKTINGAYEISKEIADLKPDTIIIVVPPHGPAFSDAVSINTDEVLEGDLGRFGQPNIKSQYECDMDITSNIINNSERNGVPVAEIDKYKTKRYNISNRLDHGSLVPLYFINQNYNNFKLVHITYGFLSKEDLYYFGRLIRKSVEETDKNVVLVASGDLSHRLTTDAPVGYSKEGKNFDKLIVDYLSKNDSKSIMYMDDDLVEEAGQCGYRSFLIMLGALDGLNAKGKVLSYEGPFGVGYCTASYTIEGEKESLIDYYFQNRKKLLENIRKGEDPYVRLARESLEYYIKHEEFMKVPDGIPNEMNEKRAGVFVSIKKDGNLRGCIGTIEPVQKSIAEEIIKNAVSAGTEDPRFYQVEDNELDSLIYSVDILGKPETVYSKEELNPKDYGVIVRRGSRCGLLLPNLPGIDDPDEQVSIALKKAGIGEFEDYSIERFKVVRHGKVRK
jgi:AmmeMemoRadiSam system protein A/AmmeMemoRadiSam system protein B